MYGQSAAAAGPDRAGRLCGAFHLLYPERTPDYSAFFCKDAAGIQPEVLCFDRPAYF